ncbi:MAG: coniferyl aldehyde dehydrogenase [Pseudomonadales bacterium]|jgi:coniferyl-aldehyde dehydrogenase|nr:coniferyl aldehyde dehydrogenase [Pseudomonadales bacterium]
MSTQANTTTTEREDTPRETMLAILAKQRQARLDEGPVSLETRIDRIDRAIGLLVDHAERFAEAMRADFGHRSVHQSLFTDIASSIGPLKHARKHVGAWMRPEKRKPDLAFRLMGAKARIEYQPLGVVGVISPWNFPVQLTFAPLAGIFAAGNRVMIKPSEYTPETSALMAELFAGAYDEDEVATIVGGPQTGADFSGLPFDHLLFTGATSVARHVMRAASEHLVPVTLELGGKSPVVLGRSADLQQATDRIMMGKMLNAGQICLAPDYVMVPGERLDEFVDASRRSVARMFPTLLDNPDYTSIVNERHFERLQGYLDDARDKGAQVLEINPADEDFRQQEHHKIPPTLVLDPSDEMKIMQDEIFGPLLPVKRYDHVDETIDYVNAHDRPLGLYYFGRDAAEEKRVLSRTTSGGVTVNDVIMHVGQEDLPFGGVGPSGMGAYHGLDGFRRFSHAKSVFTQTRLDVARLAGIAPPWGDKFLNMVKGQIKR